MKSFSIRDLRERTGELVRNAEDGHISLVAKHGHPVFVAVPLDENMLENGVVVAMACHLFSEKVLSLGKAARLAGLSAEEFIETLGRLGIPAVDYDADEIGDELLVLAS